MAALLGVKKVKIQFPEIFQNFSPPKTASKNSTTLKTV